MFLIDCLCPPPNQCGGIRRYSLWKYLGLDEVIMVEFSIQEYWSGSHSLLQGIFLTQGSNLGLYIAYKYDIPQPELRQCFYTVC